MISILQKPNFNIKMGLKKSDWDRIGMDQRKEIVNRTMSGVDLNHSQFKPYSQQTRDRKEQLGRSADIVNLMDLAQMHRALVFKSSNTYVDLYYGDTARANVAFEHQYGLGRMPKREHFGFSNTDAKKWTETVIKLLTLATKRSFQNAK